MKRRIALIIATALSLGLTACGGDPFADVTDRPSAEFKIDTISEKLVKPWGVAVLPSGGYFVTEIGGTAKIIKGATHADVTGLPDDILVNGQGGLMGVALAPDHIKTKEIYLSYAYGTPKDNGTALYRARLEGGSLTGGAVIFKSTAKSAGSHFGGRIVFLPDGTLLLSLGDGFAYREQAQVLDNTLGKIVRLNRDGSPAADNPFKSNERADNRIYSYGHRNVQGLAFDAATGNIWAHEHGPNGGDELNLLKPGANYGWPLATTGKDYNGARISPFEDMEGTEKHVYDWVPKSIAPSGLTIYRGAMFPDWEGDALVGALANKSLWHIDLDGTKAVGATRLLKDLEQRVRDVKVDRDGAVLVLTESGDGGRLLRLTPKP